MIEKNGGTVYERTPEVKGAAIRFVDEPVSISGPEEGTKVR